MSAIFGAVRPGDDPMSRYEYRAARASLAHRGAAEEAWADGSVLLERRWRSMEESRGLFSLSGLVVAADARIDNRTELGDKLEIPGVQAVPDGELIARAYLHWEDDCAQHLVGDFAFAIWDRRTHSLFCARDHMGVRPFYYSHCGGVFAFATEARAILALPGVPGDVDEEALTAFVARVPRDRSSTVFRHVQRLPAAHTLTFRGGNIRVRGYWDPGAAPEVRLRSDSDYAEAFRELFLEAVRVRLPAGGPFGTTLSGGLDSSSVACSAAQVSSDADRLHTFSLVFPGLPPEDLRRADERRYIDAVTSVLPGTAHRIRGDLLGPLTDVATVLQHVGQPYDAPNLFLHWAMYDAAAQAGVTVLLDGLDGDVVVGHGFGRLNTYARSGDWPGFESLVRSFAARRQIDPAAVLPRYGHPYLRHLAATGRWAEWTRAARALFRAFGGSRRELIVEQGLRPAIRRYTGADRTSDADFEDRALQYKSLMQPEYQLMLETADACAAAHGVEPRYPFFDRRLIEFCLGVPEEQKFSDGWSRLILRRAMEGVLPTSVQWRPDKGNLSPAFHRGLKDLGRDSLEALDPTVMSKFIREDRVITTRTRYLEGTDTQLREADGLLLFRLAVLSSWLDGAGGSVCSPQQRHVAQGCAA